MLQVLARRFPPMEIVLTLGARGAIVRTPEGEMGMPAVKVKAVDTTAAGDTFIGYYLAGRCEGLAPKFCLRSACAAAALCVTRRGAMDSIPVAVDVRKFARGHGGALSLPSRRA